MRAPALTLRLAALLALAASPACAQEVKQAAARPAASADTVSVRADSSRYKGSPSAPVVIYEFSDFQCPFCREFETKTAARLDSALVQTGRARLVFFNFPLSIHPNAWVAAEAAMCAGAQGSFWPMHERLFADQPTWADNAHPGQVFDRYARDLGLDLAAFQTCTREDQVARNIIQDLAFGAGGGLTGTPTFVLIRQPEPGEKPQDAQRVLSGAQPLEAFTTAVDELMAKKK